VIDARGAPLIGGIGGDSPRAFRIAAIVECTVTHAKQAAIWKLDYRVVIDGQRCGCVDGTRCRWVRGLVDRRESNAVRIRMSRVRCAVCEQHRGIQ
jgi:hypothetical protein